MKSSLSKISLGYLLFFILLTLLAYVGILASDYNLMNDELSYAPPSLKYPLGNDIFGRSILSRGLHAGGTALLVGFLSAFISVVVGGTLGLLAGYIEGRVDRFVVFTFTVMESIPYILLLSVIAFVLGQGFHNIYICIGLTSWVVLCRITRAECLRIKNSDYVLAAKAMGFSDGSIIFKQILPNLRSIIISQFIIVFVFSIKVEVILTYLGLGMEPGMPSWGYMLDEARQEFSKNFWWSFICVTGMMSALVLALNHLADEFGREDTSC